MFKHSLSLLVAIISFTSSCSSSFNTSKTSDDSINQELAKLEKVANGRIGISAINTSNNQRIEYRANELFPFCSTSKVIAVSAILKKSEKHPNIMKQKLTYSKKDAEKSGYAPITEKHIKDGMTISELSRAAIEYSDNAAMNLIIKFLGGPKAVNSYARSIGDNQFRIDRLEPELNSAIPNDVRDTTSPLAMSQTLQKIILGDALKPKQCQQLQAWLRNNTTGDSRIRKAVPRGWIVGDKTGTGDYGTTNDIGIIWPSKCDAPIVVTIYFTQNKKDASRRDDIVASATGLIIKELSKTNECLKKSNLEPFL